MPCHVRKLFSVPSRLLSQQKHATNGRMNRWCGCSRQLCSWHLENGSKEDKNDSKLLVQRTVKSIEWFLKLFHLPSPLHIALSSRLHQKAVLSLWIECVYGMSMRFRLWKWILLIMKSRTNKMICLAIKSAEQKIRRVGRSYGNHSVAEFSMCRAVDIVA